MFIGGNPKTLCWLSVHAFSRDVVCHNIGYCNPSTTNLLAQRSSFLFPLLVQKWSISAEKPYLKTLFCIEFIIRSSRKAMQAFCVDALYIFIKGVEFTIILLKNYLSKERSFAVYRAVGSAV